MELLHCFWVLHNWYNWLMHWSFVVRHVKIFFFFNLIFRFDCTSGRPVKQTGPLRCTLFKWTCHYFQWTNAGSQRIVYFKLLTLVRMRKAMQELQDHSSSCGYEWCACVCARALVCVCVCVCVWSFGFERVLCTCKGNAQCCYWNGSSQLLERDGNFTCV